VADLAGVRVAATVMALPVLLGLALFALVQRAAGRARGKSDDLAGIEADDLAGTEARDPEG
jgi:hypothetical protein